MEKIVNDQKPGECRLLVYTSGTTRTPKGVMLSHDNLTWTARAFFENASSTVNWPLDQPADVINYLPLSHIAGQMVDLYMPLYAACTVSFADPDALKGSIRNTLTDVKPTIFFGVPRVWEKFMEAMQAKAVTATGIAKPLHNALMKKEPEVLSWSSQMDEAFTSLKISLSDNPILLATNML